MGAPVARLLLAASCLLAAPSGVWSSRSGVAAGLEDGEQVAAEPSRAEARAHRTKFDEDLTDEDMKHLVEQVSEKLSKGLDRSYEAALSEDHRYRELKNELQENMYYFKKGQDAMQRQTPELHKTDLDEIRSVIGQGKVGHRHVSQGRDSAYTSVRRDDLGKALPPVARDVSETRKRTRKEKTAPVVNATLSEPDPEAVVLTRQFEKDRAEEQEIKRSATQLRRELKETSQKEAQELSEITGEVTPSWLKEKKFHFEDEDDEWFNALGSKQQPRWRFSPPSAAGSGSRAQEENWAEKFPFEDEHRDWFNSLGSETEPRG